MACDIVELIDIDENIKSFVCHVPDLLYQKVNFFGLNCLEMAVYAESLRYMIYGEKIYFHNCFTVNI